MVARAEHNTAEAPRFALRLVTTWNGNLFERGRRRAEREYLSVHNPLHLFTFNGFEQCIVRFTTDIPYLSRWGQPLLIGPGSIFQAHTDGEYVSKRELREAVTLYAGLARTLLTAAAVTHAGQIAEGAP